MEEKWNLQKIRKKLKKYLDEERMWHTMGVMYTAASLAMVYGEDIEKAQLAGLLHDSAKCIPAKKKLKLCQEHNIPVTDFEKSHSFLLHAKLGAWVAEEKYGVTDQEVLDAIIWHTTGRPGMTTLEKIIYIADYIEPARKKAPRLEEIRALAYKDLDLCMYEILSNTLVYLNSDPENVDKTTEEAFHYYKKLIGKQEDEI